MYVIIHMHHIGYHSHTSPQKTEWYIFNEAQACPTHVITVRTREWLPEVLKSDDGLEYKPVPAEPAATGAKKA
jgi:hypothetical protein